VSRLAIFLVPLLIGGLVRYVPPGVTFSFLVPSLVFPGRVAGGFFLVRVMFTASFLSPFPVIKLDLFCSIRSLSHFPRTMR